MVARSIRPVLEPLYIDETNGTENGLCSGSKGNGQIGVQIKRDFRIAKNQLTKQMYLKNFQIQYNIIVANGSPHVS